MGSQGKLLCILFKLPRRLQHVLDDSADLGTEILDKLIQLRFAAIHRKLFITNAFGLKLATLDAIVLEDADGPGDCADFVVPLGNVELRRPSFPQRGRSAFPSQPSAQCEKGKWRPGGRHATRCS